MWPRKWLPGGSQDPSTSCPHGCSRASCKVSEPLSKVRHENISITKTRGCLLCSIPITNWTLKTTCWVNEQMNKCMINKWLSNIETRCDSNGLRVIWHMSPYDLIKTLQEKMINKMIEMCLYLSIPTAVKGQVSKAVHKKGKCDTLCVMTWPETTNSSVGKGNAFSLFRLPSALASLHAAVSILAMRFSIISPPWNQPMTFVIFILSICSSLFTHPYNIHGTYTLYKLFLLPFNGPFKIEKNPLIQTTLTRRIV